jgi:hypothetical protein
MTDDMFITRMNLKDLRGYEKAISTRLTNGRLEAENDYKGKLHALTLLEETKLAVQDRIKELESNK